MMEMEKLDFFAESKLFRFRPEQVVPALVALAIVAIVPPAKMYALSILWEPHSRAVDKHDCQCQCWDGVFKGPYQGNTPKYKHFYFNCTENTLKIWLLLIVFILAVYESVKYITHLGLTGSLRHEMLVLFLFSLVPHYYAWWQMTNYYNDEFYEQWSHQMFFTVTEVISSALVMRLANRAAELSPGAVATVAAVAAIHVATSLWDQFFNNVFYGGDSHQVIRDVSLMIPDLLLIVVPLLSYRYNHNVRLRIKSKELQSVLIGLVFFVIFVVTFLQKFK